MYKMVIYNYWYDNLNINLFDFILFFKRCIMPIMTHLLIMFMLTSILLYSYFYVFNYLSFILISLSNQQLRYFNIFNQ